MFSDEVKTMVQLGKFPCFEVRIVIDGINFAYVGAFSSSADLLMKRRGVLLHSNMTLPHVIGKIQTRSLVQAHTYQKQNIPSVSRGSNCAGHC